MTLTNKGGDMKESEILKKEQTFNMSSSESDKDVAAYIKAGADVNYIMRFSWGETFPLCKAKNANVAEAMIKAGAKINMANSSGQTALMLNINPHVVLFLVKSGADVKLTDSKGRNALFYHTQKVMLMTLLVRAGCNPFIKDFDDKTLFDHMSKENKIKFFAELKKYKAEIDERKLVS